MKKGVLAASFGTLQPEADQRCILPIEQAIACANPDRAVRRALTSQVIINRLRAGGRQADSIPEALERMRTEGFTEIAVAPLLVIPGGEYDKARAQSGSCPVAEPLLADDADLEWMTRLLADTAARAGRTLLLMGHGADHDADRLYARLRDMLPDGVFLACHDGALTLADLLPRLDALPEKALTLSPLMLAAGRHAALHLAGDGPGSWKSVLCARGFDVRVSMRGLGSEPAVQQRFADKLSRIL